MEGAARFGLSHWLVVMAVDCGKREGNRHVLGAGWAGTGVSPVSGGTGHSVQNSIRGMGKASSSQ